MAAEADISFYRELSKFTGKGMVSWALKRPEWLTRVDPSRVTCCSTEASEHQPGLFQAANHGTRTCPLPAAPPDLLMGHRSLLGRWAKCTTPAPPLAHRASTRPIFRSTT